MKTNGDPLNTLLGRAGPDPGCEAVFELLDRYCEAVLSGADAATRFPGLALHLHNCVACREDAEGLLEVLRKEGAD